MSLRAEATPAPDASWVVCVEGMVLCIAPRAIEATSNHVTDDELERCIDVTAKRQNWKQIGKRLHMDPTVLRRQYRHLKERQKKRNRVRS